MRNAARPGPRACVAGRLNERRPSQRRTVPDRLNRIAIKERVTTCKSMPMVLSAIAATWLSAGCGAPAPVEQQPAATSPANVSATRRYVSLAEHATQLAAASALVRIPGGGVNDMTWVATPGWQNWSRAMGDAALAALKATEGENLEALVAGNGRLVESCEGCHQEFKPELPSEGIAHGHAH